ncbi:hypothetical protein IU474_09610 [Nocardia otitidiscaviarum]|uniref:hypothetical protein n=1 Tax=Nocardia otitidiscaviarum TaxID=1823 RepID=UPI0018937E81|nr:hypothetical protein [Nocardia otitidiscaviarum]MBF6237323.1 hypothetical protein [Nocardia otitidiscaviarum]
MAGIVERRRGTDAVCAGYRSRLAFSAVGSEVARTMARGGATDRLRAAIRDPVESMLRQP